MVQTRPEVLRTDIRLMPDPRRVITRFFIPGGDGRAEALVTRVCALSERQVSNLLARIVEDYSLRHHHIEQVFDEHYRALSACVSDRKGLSRDRRRLLGAYFSMEYSLESVALFNPSMVLHPSQHGLDDGSARFIVSLRACGEGHISSIEFRSGVIDGKNEVVLDVLSPFVAMQQPVPDKRYTKDRFQRKLLEMKIRPRLANRVLSQLDDMFTMDDLVAAIEANRRRYRRTHGFDEFAESILWLARSNYHLDFPENSTLPERVIFPVTENESRGIEDARFVRFVEPGGEITYYATYTAYNGLQTLPQLIETSDFRRFRMYTMNGRHVQNKGMALFPRLVNGDYRMIARLDGENLYLLRSDHVHFWNEAQRIHQPTHPWELVQIGNCGSPIETDAGWLVLTHGVGPMRQYWLGAILLDLEDPARVIGHLTEPLMVPVGEEREGYVPNVIYSCGAMLHGDSLVIPYAAADTMTGIATVLLPELLDCLADV